MEKENNTDHNISDEIIDLVIARLETIPPNISVSIGAEGDFSIEELIKRVKAKDEVGKKIIEMQLQYIKSLKKYSYIKNDSDHETTVR